MGPYRNQISSLLLSEMNHLWLKVKARNPRRGSQGLYLFPGCPQPGGFRNPTDQPCEQVCLPSQTRVSQAQRAKHQSAACSPTKVFRHIFMGARAQPQTQSKRYKLVNNCNRSECVPGIHLHVLGELILPSCNPHVNLKEIQLLSPFHG